MQRGDQGKALACLRECHQAAAGLRAASRECRVRLQCPGRERQSGGLVPPGHRPGAEQSGRSFESRDASGRDETPGGGGAGLSQVPCARSQFRGRRLQSRRDAGLGSAVRIAALVPKGLPVAARRGEVRLHVCFLPVPASRDGGGNEGPQGHGPPERALWRSLCIAGRDPPQKGRVGRSRRRVSVRLGQWASDTKRKRELPRRCCAGWNKDCKHRNTEDRSKGEQAW